MVRTSWKTAIFCGLASLSSVGLLALERRMIEVAKADRNNAYQHLRLGFLSLRLGELGGLLFAPGERQDLEAAGHSTGGVP